DEDPAAAGAERRCGWRLVPLPAGDVPELAELTGGNATPKLGELGNETAPVTDLEQDSGRGSRVSRSRRGGGAQPARLLTQDRDAGRRERLDELDVQVGRRGDQDAVEASARLQLGNGGVHVQAVRFNLGPYGLDRFDNRGDDDGGA